MLSLRRAQGRPTIADLRAAVPEGHRGRPEIAEKACREGCTACRDVCGVAAVALDPVRIDLGRCVFCDECALACPVAKIEFTASPALAARSREALVVEEGAKLPPPVEVDAALRARFGRSLRLRQVSAGGCNACELELNAISNVNFDLGRYGIEWVASPRHADALVLTGPLTEHMAEAVRRTWRAMPDPKFAIAVGACSISGGLYAESAALERAVLEELAPALLVPGCPPHPLTFIRGILELLGIETS
jgi:Ni,Fe-hydrogenase III small subunit